MTSALQNFPRRLMAVLSSYGLACALFVLLLILAWRGTIFQIEHGIFAAQQKYFTSLVVLEDLPGPLPLPLPGAYTLLVLLFVNLLLGGILRARKGWGNAGILVTHGGILLLLAGGFVTHHYSESGQLSLREKDTRASFERLDQWELSITSGDGETSTALPFDGLSPSKDTGDVTQSADLPFRLAVLDLWPNAARDGAPPGPSSALRERPQSPDPTRNLPALRAQVSDGTTTRTELTVWAGSAQPVTLDIDNRTWNFSLRRLQRPLPFSLTLDRFQLEQHPGTTMSSAVRSELTRQAAGLADRVVITMNQPLRAHGYTIYQASWGPPDDDPDSPPYSVFSVTRNPAERFPLYACLIIGAGMALHFVLRLRAHLRKLQGGSA